MLPYRDSCVISGGIEVVDQETGEVSYADVYSGKCDYQSASSAIINGVTMAQSARLYIPVMEIALDTNQFVTITSPRGRVIKATILDYQYIEIGKVSGIKINLNETMN